MAVAVFDTSTLILLAKTDLLRLVAQHIEMVIPVSVHRESTEKPQLLDAQSIRRLIDDRAIQLSSDGPPALVKRLIADFRLGHGEAATLALAKANQWAVATDDARAIKACKVTGIPFVTALTWLTYCVEQRLLGVEVAMAKLEELKQYGWYDAELLDRVATQLAMGRNRHHDNA